MLALAWLAGGSALAQLDANKVYTIVNNNDANMFETSIFPKEFDKIAQKCYMEQMDAFSKLFEDEQFYKRVMSEMAKAMYLNFRNE